VEVSSVGIVGGQVFHVLGLFRPSATRLKCQSVDHAQKMGLDLGRNLDA
jgi:hypothetical protein